MRFAGGSSNLALKVEDKNMEKMQTVNLNECFCWHRCCTT